MPLAARVTDFHSCPAASGPIPHLGGPVLPPCSVNVQTNLLPQARATDRAQCVGPPDFIVVGSSSVMVNDMMAARLTDPTMHGGVIAMSSMNVEIGGPPAGATLGNPKAGNTACLAAAASRFPSLLGATPAGPLKQSYGNCGVESSRQIINTVTGANFSQEGLLFQTVATGITQWSPTPSGLGGIYPETKSGGTALTDKPQNQFTKLLNQNGVPASEVPATSANLEQGVAEDRGVIVVLMAGTLWGPAGGIPPGTGPHAVLVTGTQYNAAGKLQNVIINDTGMGTCMQTVPAATLMSAVKSYYGGTGTHVVTDNPIW